jgi:hypothetical protein
MRYLLLACTDEEATDALSLEERSAALAEYMTFAEEMGRRGVFLSGAQLQPTWAATTVHLADGEVLVADGPFAETKEQIGGYMVVECADLDEAIEVASKLPAARSGTVEVRPIWQW